MENLRLRSLDRGENHFAAKDCCRPSLFNLIDDFAADLDFYYTAEHFSSLCRFTFAYIMADDPIRNPHPKVEYRRVRIPCLKDGSEPSREVPLNFPIPNTRDRHLIHFINDGNTDAFASRIRHLNRSIVQDFLQELHVQGVLSCLFHPKTMSGAKAAWAHFWVAGYPVPPSLMMALGDEIAKMEMPTRIIYSGLPQSEKEKVILTGNRLRDERLGLHPRDDGALRGNKAVSAFDYTQAGAVVGAAGAPAGAVLNASEVIANLNRRVNQLTTELDTCTTERDMARIQAATVPGLNNHCQRLRQDLGKMRRNLTEKENEVKEWESQYEAADVARQTAENERDNAVNRLRNATTTNRTLESQLRELQTALAEETKKRLNFQDLLKDSKTLNEDHRVTIARERQLNGQLQQTIDELKKEKIGLEDQINKAAGKLDDIGKGGNGVTPEAARELYNDLRSPPRPQRG